MRLFDYNDHFSARVPKRRKVDLEFDRVVSMESTFSFFLSGKFICCIDKDLFTRKQVDFFEGISEP